MKYSVSLKRNNEFRRLYNKGTSSATPAMVIYCRRNGKQVNRLGITVSTKLGGAVRRNRIRRRLRETYRLNEDKLRRGFDVVIVARTGAYNAPWKSLNGEFRRICGKIGLLAAVTKDAGASGSKSETKPKSGGYAPGVDTSASAQVGARADGGSSAQGSSV